MTFLKFHQQLTFQHGYTAQLCYFKCLQLCMKLYAQDRLSMDSCDLQLQQLFTNSVVYDCFLVLKICKYQ